ncbi:hypothetical protein CYMTET_11020 [Cymbomonas tetramitiformis]|uniref:Uncharacterized protein n=1 Tax=Cymbomonas tetramitiformis TaxID=36881 RepID=A0AAE0GMY3_9CHLO|nr:hypothetical protein CYMTET_11020 [Cymbomonas tetramitiformis]
MLAAQVESIMMQVEERLHSYTSHVRRPLLRREVDTAIRSPPSQPTTSAQPLPLLGPRPDVTMGSLPSAGLSRLTDGAVRPTMVLHPGEVAQDHHVLQTGRVLRGSPRPDTPSFAPNLRWGGYSEGMAAPHPGPGADELFDRRASDRAVSSSSYQVNARQPLMDGSPTDKEASCDEEEDVHDITICNPLFDRTANTQALVPACLLNTATSLTPG